MYRAVLSTKIKTKTQNKTKDWQGVFRVFNELFRVLSKCFGTIGGLKRAPALTSSRAWRAAGAAVDSAQSAMELAAKEEALEALERGGAGREEVDSARLEASGVREE